MQVKGAPQVISILCRDYYSLLSLSLASFLHVSKYRMHTSCRQSHFDISNVYKNNIKDRERETIERERSRGRQKTWFVKQFDASRHRIGGFELLLLQPSQSTRHRMKKKGDTTT